MLAQRQRDREREISHIFLLYRTVVAQRNRIHKLRDHRPISQSVDGFIIKMLWNFSHIKATQLSWLVQNCDPIMFPVKATHVLWSLDYKLMMSLWNGSKKHCPKSIIHVRCRYLNQCFVITSGTRAVSEWKWFLIGEITIGSQETMLYTRSTIHSPLPIWSKANTLFGRKPQGPHQQLWATSAIFVESGKTVYKMVVMIYFKKVLGVSQDLTRIRWPC